MKLYTFEIQNCIEIKVKGNSQEEARLTLLENDDLWYEEFLDSAIIHNSIKEEEIEE